MIINMLQQSGSSWNFQTEAVLEQFVWDNLKSLLGLTPLKRQIYVAGQYCDIIAVSSDKQLVIIELAYYKGMTHTKIALATGKSLGTIKTRIRLGLHKLRESIPQDWLK